MGRGLGSGGGRFRVFRAPQQPLAIRFFLAVVASAVFVSVLTGAMVNVMLPVIRAEFGASAAQIGWVVTGFSLAFAASVPLYGRVSDLYGVRRVFVLGICGFALGGLSCALAPSLPLLVAGRMLQAAGGAAIPALATVAVAKVIPPGARGGALGLVSSSIGAASAVGPIVGGVLGQLLGWRALFVGSLSLALLLIPFALRALPGDRAQSAQRLDLLGGVLFGLGAGLFLFGITQGQTAGFASFPAWGSFVAAGLAWLGFFRRIHRAAAPFVSPALFANRGYVAALVVGFSAMFASFSALVFVPLLLVEENGLSPAAAGLALTPGAAALALLSPLSGRLSDRVGVRRPIVAGLATMGASLLLLSVVAGGPPAWVVLGVLGVYVGFAFVQSPVNNAAAGALARRDVGAGVGLFSGVYFLGAGSGPAAMGALLAARQEAAGFAVNPLYRFGAAPFSDTFLGVVVVLAGALVASAWLRERSPPAEDASLR
jgi:DHA2 family metal-tetracycline-proton antiporter-like MFS transporter